MLQGLENRGFRVDGTDRNRCPLHVDSYKPPLRVCAIYSQSISIHYKNFKGTVDSGQLGSAVELMLSDNDHAYHFGTRTGPACDLAIVQQL